MVLPNAYQTASDSPLQTVTSVELASGVVTVPMYLSIVNVSGGTTKDYVLTANQIYAASNGTTNTPDIILTGTATTFDDDFDILINSPINVLGNVLVSINALYEQGSNNATTPSRVVTLTLQRVRGGVETDIATTNPTLASGTSLGVNSDTPLSLAATMSVSSLTNFAIGDTLRLRLQIAAETGGASTDQQWNFGLDPKGRRTYGATNQIPNTSIMYLPVRPDN